ncbi:MAG: hypothetical protein KIT31_17290 [Deltaproteobacteria bacterium]|nr:hypothetical protein [Deltaproteobacteria bacterium]
MTDEPGFVVRGGARDLAPLSAEAVLDRLASFEARDVRMFDRDVPVDPAEFRDGERIVVDGVRRWLAAGKSVYAFNACSHFADVRALCLRIGELLGVTAFANLYLSPAQASAYKRHRDKRDRCVVQASGAKRWWLEHPVPCLEDGAITERSDLVLDAGDLMYLSRHNEHEARALDAGSVHLTLRLLGEPPPPERCRLLRT